MWIKGNAEEEEDGKMKWQSGERKEKNKNNAIMQIERMNRKNKMKRGGVSRYKKRKKYIYKKMKGKWNEKDIKTIR